MPQARLQIAIDFPGASGIHRVRNFGEDLWRVFCDD